MDPRIWLCIARFKGSGRFCLVYHNSLFECPTAGLNVLEIDWNPATNLYASASQVTRVQIPSFPIPASDHFCVGFVQIAVITIFAKPDQTVQVGSGDAETASSLTLIAVVLANSAFGQFEFVVANQLLK